MTEAGRHAAPSEEKTWSQREKIFLAAVLTAIVVLAVLASRRGGGSEDNDAGRQVVDVTTTLDPIESEVDSCYDYHSAVLEEASSQTDIMRAVWTELGASTPEGRWLAAVGTKYRAELTLLGRADATDRADIRIRNGCIALHYGVDPYEADTSLITSGDELEPLPSDERPRGPRLDG